MKPVSKKRNSVEFEVYSNHALFSEPATRVGGEKFSYQVPTYQSIKGILESIYWKPTIVWVIDAIRVMNKIQTEGKGIRPVYLDGSNDLAYYTYLKDVRYQVLAHFEWNENRNNLQNDRNENKHHNIALRSIEKGGRRDIFLGTRECQGYVEPCEFGSRNGFYDDHSEIDFGFMYHGITYPDESNSKVMGIRFYRCIMNNGIIEFGKKSDESIRVRQIPRKINIKEFITGTNFVSILDEDKEVIS